MDFSEVARSVKRGVRASCQDLAAEVVGHANPSTLIDNTSGRVAKAARELAAEVVDIIRCLSSRKDRGPQTSSVQGRGQEQSRVFDTGLLEVRAQLARDGVPSQLFQAQLLLALRHEKSREEAADDKIPSTEGTLGKDEGAGSSSVPPPRASGGARGECCPPSSLTIYWWLHKSGLLPMSRLLEANETLPPPSAVPHRCVREGQRDSFAEPVEDWVDIIVQDFRALAGQPGREAGDPDSRNGYTAADADLVSDVAKYLFDLGYREVPSFEDVGSGGNAEDALSRRAARRVLDRLCCGPELFGRITGSRSVGAEARMRGCLAALDALDPVAAPAVDLEANPAAGSKRSANDLLGTTSTTITGEEGVLDAAGATPVVEKDAPTAAFLARQLRLLLEYSSGHSSEHTQNEYASKFEADIASSGGASCLLVGILHHFSPAQFIEVLRSICRGAVAGAADTTGWHIYKPLLRWESLGPVVRAAATAHAKEVPPAVALIGTELAAAAVNLVPPGEADGKGMARRNQHQGVVVLLAAFRLVAQADVCLRGARRRSGEGGLYARWVRSCFGVESSRGDGDALLEVDRGELREGRPGHGQKKEASEPACEDAPYLHGSEAVREAMEKQRASGILMEALCSSVPYDPAFVLEVHKDVLIMRLRAKFSVQVRDFVDLVATRLSDLKDQEEALRRKSAGTGFGRSVGVGASTSRATGLAGDDGDATTREVGFFLRQFKQNGEVPLALKTAILWQPKSWAKIRKILLAPPGERIAMPDGSGNAVPELEGVVKETIGRGENGLRVEVSLKYRRLLVQQLAKESLLSAKDHDVFRKSYIEYLQGQRERDAAQSESPEKSKAMTAVARQLVLLESKLEQRKQVGNRQAREGSEGIGQTEGDRGVVPQRLALLLQEYLPRALVVELCMEDDDEAPYRMRPSSTGEGTPRGERSLDSSPDRDWFSRAAHLFTQVLQEWEHCFRTEVTLPGIGARPPAQAGASPAEVAEAILNSTHCCVAAIGASLGQDLLLSVLAPVQPCPKVSATSGIPEVLERGPGGKGGRRNQGLSPEAKSGTNETAAFLGLPVARALRRIGEVISIAAGVEPLGEALCRRCSSLLTNPSRLDPKQLLSLAHVLAGLPSAFRPKVERLFADLIAEALPHKSAGGGSNARRSRSSTKSMVGLTGTAQVGVLYLQSMLVLHGQISTSVAEKIPDASLEGSPTGPSGEDARTCRRQSKGGRQSFVLAGSDDRRGDPSSPLGKVSVGFAPVALLEYLWWVERRLSFARSTALEQGCGSHLAPGLAGLSRLLERVLKHPLIERALKQMFGAPGTTMPPFERLIALEVAASNGEDFCSASAKLTFLESVTLSRLVPGPADNTEGLETGEAKCVRRRLLSAQQRKEGADTNSIVARVKDVWTECAACLFGEPGLRAAAARRVGRDATPTAFEEGHSVESRGESLGWDFNARALWRNSGADSVPGSNSGGGDRDGVQVILDSILQVMGKLCSLEAAAVSVGRRSGPALHLKEMDDAAVAEKHSCARGASLLLTETLALLKRRDATREGAVSPGLVLIAEIAIPAIGATEGRGKAIASLRLMWEEWFSKVRPLEYGAVVSLTRVALMWCGDDYDTRPSGGRDNGCPVVQMLEDLPLLAAEMASVWPRLARTLQPVIGTPHVPVGPYARGGWAFHLSNLHFVGGELFQSLTSTGFEPSKSDREAPTREATIESTTRPPMTSKGDGGQTRSKKDGRIPLGPVNPCPQGQSEGQPRGQAGGKDCLTKNSPRAEDVIDVDATPHAKVLPARAGAVEPSHRARSRGALTSLPRTCAKLILGVINASASALDAMPIAKRPREVPVPVGDAKRAKTHSLGLGASLGTAAAFNSNGRGDGELLERFDVHQTSSVVASQSSAIEVRTPPPALWVARVIEPLYGPRKENDGVSPLGVLLETLINELGESRRCDTGKGGERRIRVGGVFRYLAVSLVVAILRYAPPLVAHLAEPPCLVSLCDSPTSLAERLGRSLAVLNSMGLLFGADVPPRQPGSCLTVVLTHYTAALLSMSSIRNHSRDEQAARALPNGREWANVVAFVHARVKNAAAEELRLMPAAKAAQEVDPLLAQYFC